MNRFFLTLTVIILYGFSSSDHLRDVFDRVNNGRTIENRGDYDKFDGESDDSNNAELSLIPDVYISLAKYNLQQADYATAYAYFNKALHSIKIPESIKEDEDKYRDALLSYFPQVLVHKLLLNDDLSVQNGFLNKTFVNIYPKMDNTSSESNVGIIEFAHPSSKFTSYFQAVTEVENVIKSSGNLRDYADADIKYIEKQTNYMPDLKFKTLTGLLIADYYINKEYAKSQQTVNQSIDFSVNYNIKRAVNYISHFMIEYMDYDSISKYIKQREGLEPFGDYLGRVNASVVLQDIENAIIAYYFSAFSQDQTFPLPTPLLYENERLQISQNSTEQEGQINEQKVHGDKRKGYTVMASINDRREIEQERTSSKKKQTWGEWFYSWKEWFYSLGK